MRLFTCAAYQRPFEKADGALLPAAKNKRLPQSEDELRCPALELSLNHLRYCPVGQEELDYPHSEW